MKSAVEQIKEKLSILDVVGGYVELHRAGKSWKGKSPFTNEKTPSFHVSPDRGMYYCFSTSQGGDMFSFIQTMEGVDFKGALKILADKAGVELVAENPEKRSARDRAHAILEEATVYYFAEGQKSTQVQEYLKSRGVTTETAHGWRIGLAPDGWRNLREHLKGKGYTDAEMLAAGLVKSADGKDPYDVFRNRVMFPISDPSGHVIGFSGRTLSDDPKNPKYVNSPETELFKKGEMMYGYHLAKNNIRHHDFSLVVEGQFDVVMSHQVGYQNTVAVSGTGFTMQHIDLLSRLSGRSVLCFDSDKAGIAATKRAAEPMLLRGMDVKVARIIGGKDPADIAKDHPEEFKKIIGGATTVIEWLLTLLKEGAKDERAFIRAAEEEILPLIAVIPSRIEVEFFANEVAKATGISKEAILGKVDTLIALKKKSEPAKGEPVRRPVAPLEAPKAEPHHDARIHDHLLFFHTLLSILATEPKKKIMYERVQEAVEKILQELATFSDMPQMPTEHDINDYIARRTREIKRDFEETERAEHFKTQSFRIAQSLTQFHRNVIAYHASLIRAQVRAAQAGGENVEELQHKLLTVERARPDYKPEELLV
ncbi:DNA primase [Candidatus Kaiserbacteria bacterium RIFCSPHIGHO2_02_FULL_50_50]|uniref:DNA primase n=1 Tax=Candidatus Kaiserbacteria bacterium RIFCSPHIGHO2_02_FULL_50_50 TaxID=1798492 RepID=A0A1F6DH00_9BACT|nr:MAG: DNA primase [Candidatus Kaiserbacteria bacterium RIFCSPHIGHO2_02_FULL_50_50]OGG88208.1 MAG: DNA primase [Candidatus Kaiserbacteria bacterium RIFCSPLOWO2_12_FULL_50_10]